MLSQQLLQHVRNGGIVAYPTSTLPGLACLPEARSLDGLFALKQRPSDKPVSLGVLSLEQATDLVHVPEKVRQLEAAFPKGGFTFILDAVEPLDVRLGGARVAVRCLAHPTARLLVEAFGPITATSANESGETPAMTSEEAGPRLDSPTMPFSAACAPEGGQHDSQCQRWSRWSGGNCYERGHCTFAQRGSMVEESNLKYWRDAGHVARRTLEAMKDELQPGKTFHEIIESAERFIHRFAEENLPFPEP